MIKQAGDIHPNPGPIPKIQRGKFKEKSQNKMHTMMILITTTLLISRIHKLKETVILAKTCNNNDRSHIEYVTNICYVTIKHNEMLRKRKLKCNLQQSLAKHLCIMLILLSGDIHVNPGPNNTRCSKCLRDIEPHSTTLKCETCMKSFHEKCNKNSIDVKNISIQGRRFSWICPYSPSCRPN